jgi:hypothetical protein
LPTNGTVIDHYLSLSCPTLVESVANSKTHPDSKEIVAILKRIEQGSFKEKSSFGFFLSRAARRLHAKYRRCFFNTLGGTESKYTGDMLTFG